MNQEQRNYLFDRVDKRTFDKDGKQLEYGRKYKDTRHPEYVIVIPCGLDVRGNAGWVFCWVEPKAGYECLVSEYLVPAAEEEGT